MVSVDLGSTVPLVEQIRAQWAGLIDARQLPAGTRLPSVRAHAKELGVSKYTISDAYERLTAQGYLRAHAGSGYYVGTPRQQARQPQPAQPAPGDADYLWLVRRQLAREPGCVNVSGGSLPGSWDDQALLHRALRRVANMPAAALGDYGEVLGYLPLRQLLQVQMAHLGVRVAPEQIVTTLGATHALELVMRLLLKPSEACLVEDPGYFSLFANLHLHGVRLLPVRRTPEGPDLAQLEALAREYQPKVFFLQSVLHSPTGSSMPAEHAHRLLQCARRLDLTLVEHDFYADLADAAWPRLATLDQLERTVYVGAFSRTVMGPARLGYVVGSPALTEQIGGLKLLGSVTAGQLNERLAYQVMCDSAYRRHLHGLRRLLAERVAACTGQLLQHGLELFCRPAQGKYLWVRHPHVPDSAALAEQARRHNLLLAPGSIFRPGTRPTPWFRVNVAQSDHTAWAAFLHVGLEAAARR